MTSPLATGGVNAHGPAGGTSTNGVVFGVTTELFVAVVDVAGCVVEDATVASVVSVVASVVAVDVVVGCGFVVGVVGASVVGACVAPGADVSAALPDVDGCELLHAPTAKHAAINHPPQRRALPDPLLTRRPYTGRRGPDPCRRSVRALTASSASRRISARARSNTTVPISIVSTAAARSAIPRA
ncbi:MAG: hypothetical protein JWL72_1163 [Ilumatobacteraceae bacterium]|nr:hypothetical protein [Ilumatobacteraceae bacterium]